jgi:hypothetical protein
MNLEVNTEITRANAEEIARQLGFLHNTFGIVARDLIKILSFKFPQESIQIKENQYNYEGNQKNKSRE